MFQKAELFNDIQYIIFVSPSLIEAKIGPTTVCPIWQFHLLRELEKINMHIIYIKIITFNW
jgi:hypothetical protein